MKFQQWPKRDPDKNYFKVPNEVFHIGLSYPEISIYCYLLSIEDRETYQCYPSYRTIGEAVGMSRNTVAKYVRQLEEKGLIRHEAGSKARVYHPALSRDETALAETRTLLEKAFDGSVGLLVNTLIQQNSLTQSDLDGLYEILRQAEEGEEGAK